MNSPQSARFALRDATAPWHQRVDAVFSAADLADRGGYGRFLSAQAAAFLPLERALDAGQIERVLADWPDRRRADLICQDLAALGLPLPPLAPSPVLIGVPAMLGAIYVLEGSRLGGKLLKRSVSASSPTAFLSGGTGGAWHSFIALLNVRLATPAELDEAIAAANDVFALFEHCGRRFL